MKQLLIAVLVLFQLQAQAQFDTYFTDKALRIDYYHTGNHSEDIYSLDRLLQEPYWGGSKTTMTDIFSYGKYRLLMYDSESSKLIYSTTYNTLFQEWQTTSEAKTTVKSFSETVVCPFPKKPVRIEFQTKNRKGVYEKKFEYDLSPTDIFISKERQADYPKLEIHHSGDPAVKVDIVVLPEGYTSSEMNKFKEDAKKFASYLFAASPFTENREKFNIWAVLAPSQESGTDIPGDGIWKNTLLGSSFYTFGTERYLMTNDNKAVRNVASNAPYDQIYIIVNSKKYGGGAIYNHYAVSVNNSPYSEYIYTHEFGHSFAGLGDEYFDSETSYNEFYPLDVEPPDPNLTTLVNFDSKWKDMIEPGTPIPTPATTEWKKKTGVFEGGGYVRKGVYRPAYDCTMKSISVNNFCPVCRRAIQRMIDFHTK